MLNRLKLNLRICLLGSLVILAFCLVASALYPKLRTQFYEEKKEKTRNLVESAASLVEHFVEEARAGRMSVEEAQAQAQALIASLRYDGNNYYWINDLGPSMVMHPIKPQLNGSDLSDLKDPNDKRLFVEMARIAKAQGSGFVDYYWPKPGRDEPAAKISFVTLQADWGWIIGSGIYVDDAEAQLTSLFRFVYGAIGLVAIVSLLAFYYIARGISRPIDRIIEQIDTGSNRISAATSMVSNCSTRLAHEATQQASSLVNTSSAVGQISEDIEDTARSSLQADAVMNESDRILQQASRAMDELIRSMEKITQSSHETANIVKTIDEIAFQTNILALNASVEAARAGEAGTGFAVVADEVRNLAGRAAEAASNTSTRIEDTVARINEGEKFVSGASKSLQEAVRKSAELMQLVATICQASSRQKDSIRKINTSIEEIDSITSQNAANAEESAGAAEELNGEATQLHCLIDDLAAIVNGSAKSIRSSNSRSPSNPSDSNWNWDLSARSQKPSAETSSQRC